MSTQNLTNAVSYTNQSLPSNLESYDHCSSNSSTTTLNLIYSIYLSLLTLIGTMGNLVVCYAVARFPQLRKNVINLFIVSLAISDLLICVVLFPMKITNSFHNQMFCGGPGSCYAYILCDLWLFISSVSALFFISVCRFLAITRPTTYTVDLSHRRVGYILAFVWIQSAGWSALSVLDWKSLKPSVQFINQNCLIKNHIYYTVVYILFIFLPLLITGIMFVLAWKTLKRSNKEVSNESYFEKIKRKRELQVTITLTTVYCTFIICWVPFCISTATNMWCPECFNRIRTANEDAFIGMVLVFGNALPCFFPAINPFIYALYTPRYKEVLASIFQRSNGKRQEGRPRDMTMSEYIC